MQCGRAGKAVGRGYGHGMRMTWGRPCPIVERNALLQIIRCVPEARVAIGHSTVRLDGVDGRRRWGCTQFLLGRSRMTKDPRISTMPGRSTHRVFTDQADTAPYHMWKLRDITPPHAELRLSTPHKKIQLDHRLGYRRNVKNKKIQDGTLVVSLT